MKKKHTSDYSDPFDLNATVKIEEKHIMWSLDLSHKGTTLYSTKLFNTIPQEVSEVLGHRAWGVALKVGCVTQPQVCSLCTFPVWPKV